MAIIWQDGFDLYNNFTDFAMCYAINNTGGPVSFSTTGGRFGGGGLSFPRQSYGITRSVPSETEVWVSFAMNVTDNINNDAVFCIFASSASPAHGWENAVSYNSATGVWKWSTNYNVTLLGSATQVLSPGWHWIDLHLKHDPTGGICEIWVDDTQLLNLTGVNTAPNGNTYPIIAVGFGDISQATSMTWQLDDVFVYTPGTRLGDTRIETVEVSSDVGPNQATPSSGTSHYAMVNEAQWSSANSLLMPNTSGDKEVFGVSAITSTPAIVHSVRVLMVSEKTDAGAYSLEPLVISSGTESDGSSQALTTSFGVQSAIFETDPHTGSAWNYLAANAAQIGFKVP